MSDVKLGYNLTIEQTQKLVMTPELIQAIQILQFNTQELESYVQEQLLVNPVLEQDPASGTGNSDSNQANEAEVERLDWKEFIRNNQYDDISYRGMKEKDENDDKANYYERYVSSDVTLPEHLMFQFQFVAKNNECRRVGKYIIESLDENGYMTSSVAEIAEALDLPVDKVDQALSLIQGLDPAGVGARNLQECLKIQLKHMGMLTDEMRIIIDEHLEDLAKNKLSAVAKIMGMSAKDVQAKADLIRTLEPKPGRQFTSEIDTKYIIPDVLVEKIDDEYQVTLNDSSTPSLTVSSYYKSLLNQAEDDTQLADYLSDRVNSAVWLIKSIEQRKQTIFNVVSCVVKNQRDFFDYGSKYMKTLTLKDIAEEVGIHESTVSRSINGKYLQCSRGVFEIKYFFSAGVSDSMGEGVSSKSIKEFIREMVSKEDAKKPYSDQKLMEMLNNKGFNISRRTVAKYRDELGILSSSKRKRY